MITVTEALALILSDIRPLPPKPMPLSRVIGHILSQDALAPFDLPPFSNSGVDGFAVRAGDLDRAAVHAPVSVKLLGEVKAGDSPIAFPDEPGCLRIMTGAPVPPETFAVVMKEDVAAGPDGAVLFHRPPPAGENIRPQGHDVQHGSCAVPVGTLIRPSELAMLACLGLDHPTVYPRPRVAIFTTGDEVIPVGTPLRPGQIYDSNRYMLEALTASSNFLVTHSGHLPDKLDATVEAFAAAAPHHDAIVTSGGVSVGEHDHVRAALEKLGEVRFWRVAMKPGKPVAYGRIGECAFFGLPGNPVSTLVGFELFVRPALLQMAGHSRLSRPCVRARLLAPVPHRAGREEFVRVLTTRSGEEFVASPWPAQASHMVSSLVAANSLAILPAEAGSLPEGARVDVLMMEWPEEEQEAEHQPDRAGGTR